MDVEPHPQLKALGEQRLDEANALWEAPSLLHVGLGWLREPALHGAKVSTLRNYISRLFAVETFQLEPAINLELWDDDIVKEMTAAIVLGFYAGLLATKKLVAWFSDWVARRRAEFAGPALKPYRLNQIALFGPAGNPARYTREALIDPLIRWMRTYLGDDVDFHLLRHSFASWLMLRFYAMRHPGFADHLPQRAATMFQPNALERLRVHYDGDVHVRDGIDDGIHIRDLVGHESLQTTLLYYTHTLDWIHADVLRRAFNEGPRHKLT